ncbi:MAG TPA: DTW domain-containing protein [Polyangiaceae bacterium]
MTTATAQRELAGPGAPSTPREICQGCKRPARVCVCAAVVRVPTRTRVVILQHPRESSVPINTARLAELGLPNAERHVGVEFATSPRVRELLADHEAPAILLYPGEGAKSLTREPPTGPVTLIVIDGTWWQARKLVRKNPELASLPRYALDPTEPSRYRIRREPAAHCVSTIEAIVQALGCLERDTPGLEGLLAPFDAMVEHQLYFARGERAARHLARPRRPRTLRFPAAFGERAGDLVVGYAETNAWPRGTPLGEGSEVVHLVAERLGDGARFEAFVAPRRPLTPSFEHHTGIAPERVLAGESLAVFHERWQAFLRPSDILAGWGWFWSEALRHEGIALPERIDLRLFARRKLREKCGDVSQCAERLGAVPERPWAAGRTGVRAAGALAVARALVAAVRDRA